MLSMRALVPKGVFLTQEDLITCSVKVLITSYVNEIYYTGATGIPRWKRSPWTTGKWEISVVV